MGISETVKITRAVGEKDAQLKGQYYAVEQIRLFPEIFDKAAFCNFDFIFFLTYLKRYKNTKGTLTLPF